MLIRDAPIAVPDSDYFLFFPHALLAMLDYETAFQRCTTCPSQWTIRIGGQRKVIGSFGPNSTSFTYYPPIVDAVLRYQQPEQICW